MRDFILCALFPDVWLLDLILGETGQQWLVGKEPPELENAYANACAIIASKPDDVEALFVRGVVSKSRGRYAEALADFREVVRLDPNHAKALSLLSEVLACLGEFDQAKATAQRATLLTAETNP